MRYDLIVLYETALMAVLSLPRFRAFNALKSAVLRLLGARVGRRVVFYPGVWIMPAKRLRLGDDVDLARGVMITTPGGVTIGDRTLVGYGTKILSSNHRVPQDRGSVFHAGHEHAPVVIESDVWIGANVVVLPGVTVREGAVVAAGSIVTRDVPPFTVVAGVPAKPIRTREGAVEEGAGPALAAS